MASTRPGRQGPTPPLKIERAGVALPLPMIVQYQAGKLGEGASPLGTSGVHRYDHADCHACDEKEPRHHECCFFKCLDHFVSLLMHRSAAAA